MQPNALLLYKNRPVRLVRIGERLEVEQENGALVKVRPKDVALLHPGPVQRLSEVFDAPPGELHAAWEILAGGETRLPELAELAFGVYTPATAWAAWQAVAEGLLFTGSTLAITAATAEEVARRQQDREQASAGRQAWHGLIDRVKRAQILPEDAESLREVESLAVGQSHRSQVLRALGRAETPDNAHALLLELGLWKPDRNPYPQRLGLPLDQPDLPVPALPDEPRRDLTHLPAFAIDDGSSDTPDDAISLDGSRVWVHVADAAALVEPDSALDADARARASSLHLPEGTVHLLPREVTRQLGLGLQAVNPALSFGIDLSEQGDVLGFEIVPSRVRVTRLTYEAANLQMDSMPFAGLERLLSAVRARRIRQGAVLIDFPEVNVHVVGECVQIEPVRVLRSRTMVEEAMILASSEAARFAVQHGLAMPFSQQEPIESEERPASLSGMFALRRLMKRSRFFATPGPHHGLGVPAYTPVTSPLRRYLDLVGHQQLRAFLRQQPLLDEPAVVERIGQVDSLIGSIRQAEVLSERHWTLVYLLQNPNWAGEGIVVERRGASGIVLVPELAVEARAHLPAGIALDQRVRIHLTGIHLAQRDATWRVDGPVRAASPPTAA